MITEIRKEYKRILDISETVSFFKKNEKKLIEIHEPRFVTSLYFDTVNYSLYKSSIEKDVDTYKVRVRTYSNNKNYFKEVKKNMSSGKYKLIEPLDIKSFSEIPDLFINGHKLYPTLFTKYKRRYFNLDNNCRITLDTDVHFISHKCRTPVEEKMNYSNDILEFKQFETNLNIEKYIDKNPVAFSKYKYGIEKVYGI